jgi:hypothetical protein
MLLGQDLQHSLRAQSISFNLHALFNRIPLSFKQKASDQNIQIHLKVDQLLPINATGDQSLLYKALLLIVEHRLQELNYGVIRIFATRANDPRSPQIHLKVRLEDSGTPFNQDAIDQIWNHSPTLGSHDFQLILVRDMILAMGGEFRVSHDPIAGNCFHIQVILERSSQDDESSHETQNAGSLVSHPRKGQPKHALLYQKFDTAQPSLGLNLKELGMKTHDTSNLQEVASTLFIEKPDVVFFEVNNAQDCDRVINNLQKIPDLSNLPVICLSIDQALQDYALSAGATDFIHSPPNLATLQDVIVRNFS